MPQSPSRPTRLATNIVTLLLLLAAAFGVFLLVQGTVGAIRGGHRVAVHQIVSIDELDSLPAGLMTQDVPVTLRVNDAKPEQVIYSVARDLIPGVLFIAGLWLLRSILRSVRDGDPFIAANVRRLRIIGLLFLVGGPLAEILSSSFEQALASSVGVTGVGPGISFPGPGPIAGLFVFVLAEVFAHGVRLRDDAEGTI
jgi:hypothetical protein